MKKLTCIIAFTIILTLGCKKNDDIDTDCVKSKIAESGMVVYDGQEIGCNFFLMLYNYEGEQYFLLGSNCADMISYPVDCNGNNLCDSYNSSNCNDFFDNAEFIKIIAIGE
jgi:hypothetical protein